MDERSYIVGTWTKPDDEAPRTGLWRIRFGEDPRAEPVDPSATAIYWATREPGGDSLLLLNNDRERSALLRWIPSRGGLPARSSERWSSGGIGGSFLSFHPDGRHFVVANAHAGWSLFRNGAEPRLLATRLHEGSGPHPRQARSHPHSAIFSADGAWLYAADMGADEVLAIPVDVAAGTLGEVRVVYRATPGSGPRHLLAGDGVIYLLNELGNTLEVLRPAGGDAVVVVQKLDTLPPGVDEPSHTAHLGMSTDRTRIFATNRQHDSIAVFDVVPGGGLRSRAWVPSGGGWPWHFLVDGDRMLVANNQSDVVTLFAVAGESGLERIGEVPVPRPVVIARES